jgi:hypothetical protein
MQMSAWSEWLVRLAAGVIVVGVPLVGLYIRESIKGVVREQTDRALADQRHEHDRVLAALNAEHQRRTHESGLYAQEQHRVYATLYRRVREASDVFSQLIGLTSGPDFEKYDAKMAQAYLERAEVAESDRGAAIAAYEKGDNRRAAQLMNELERRVRLRDAERAFIRAKNLEALYELYLSDPVRACMSAVREKMANVSVNLMRDDEDRVRPMELYQSRLAMEAAVTDLYTTMRQELREGRSVGQ